MRRSTVGARRAVLACAASLTAILALGSGAAAASAPACATSGLVVWINTGGNAAAGSSFFNLEVTNLSARTCTLQGYPGVSGVDLSGHQLGSAAARNNTGTPRVVTLRHGQSATVVLRIVDAGNFPASSCRQVIAAGLLVYPPGQTAGKLVPFPFFACTRSGPVYLTVEAVRKQG